MDAELKPAVSSTHPFQTLSIGKVVVSYLLISYGLYKFGYYFLGITTVNPAKAPLSSVLMDILHLGVQVMFICYFLGRLKDQGHPLKAMIGTAQPYKQSLSYLPMLGVKIVLSICALSLIECLWPLASLLLRGFPNYLAFADSMDAAERLRLLMFNSWNLIYIVLLVPICEELIFRGWMLHRLAIVWRSVPAAIFGSSLIFGVLHGENVLGATCFGLMASAIYLKTGSLYPSMLLHVLNNLLSMSISILLARPSQGQKFPSLQPDKTGATIYALGLVACLGVFTIQLIRSWPDKNTPLPMMIYDA